MIDLLKGFFGRKGNSDSAAGAGESGHDTRIAACALFLEMANIDGEFSEEEEKRILSILRKDYNLPDEHALALLEASRAELDGGIDLWRFTNSINQNYSMEEKLRIIDLVWRIAYADGRLDGHEDYLIHKLAKLLRLTHGQLIEAKIRVIRP